LHLLATCDDYFGIICGITKDPQIFGVNMHCIIHKSPEQQYGCGTSQNTSYRPDILQSCKAIFSAVCFQVD